MSALRSPEPQAARLGTRGTEGVVMPRGLDRTRATAPPDTAPVTVRWADVLPAAVVGAALAMALLLPARLAALAPTIAVAGIVLGVPHGAVDHLVPGWVANRSFRGRWLVRVLALYVATAVVAAVAFWLNPSAMLGLFLVVSVAHFGWGDVVYSAERRGDPPPRVREGALVSAAHGLAVIGLPLAAWPTVSEAVLAPLAPGLATGLAGLAGSTATLLILGLVAVAVTTLLARDERRSAAELVGVTLLFAVVTPLAAFGLYFGLWHAVRHTSRLLPLVRPAGSGAERVRAYALAATVPTALALASLAVVGWGFAEGPAAAPVVSAGVGVMLALTFPHVGVVALLDRSRQVR